MKNIVVGLIIGFLLAVPVGAYANAYITSSDVVDGSLLGVDLRNKTVTRSKIGKASVNSKIIANRSVKPIDLNRSVRKAYWSKKQLRPRDLDALFLTALWCLEGCSNSNALSKDHKAAMQALRE